MKRKIMTLAAMLMIAVMLCACGKTETPAPAPAPANDTAVTSQPQNNDTKPTDSATTEPVADEPDEPADEPDEPDDEPEIIDDSVLEQYEHRFYDAGDILGSWSSMLYDSGVYFNEDGEFGYSYYDGTVPAGCYECVEDEYGNYLFEVYYDEGASEMTTDIFRVWDRNHIIDSGCVMYTRDDVETEWIDANENGAMIEITCSSLYSDEAPELDVFMADEDGWRAHKASEWVEGETRTVNIFVPSYFNPQRLVISSMDFSTPSELYSDVAVNVEIIPNNETFRATSYDKDYLSFFLHEGDDGSVMYDASLDWDNFRLTGLDNSDLDEESFYDDDNLGELEYYASAGTITCSWSYPDGVTPLMDVRLYDIYEDEIYGELSGDGDGRMMVFNIDSGVFPNRLEIMGNDLADAGLDYSDLECILGCENETYEYATSLEGLGYCFRDANTPIGCYYIFVDWRNCVIGSQSE